VVNFIFYCAWAILCRFLFDDRNTQFAAALSGCFAMGILFALIDHKAQP
jgi:hypothetical protein